MEKIALSLLEHGTPQKAASALGMSATTVRRWTRVPEFQARYSQLRREAYGRALGRLQHGADGAVSTVLRIMVDTQAPVTCRVSAAVSVLQYGNCAMTDELQARIERLEQAREDED